MSSAATADVSKRGLKRKREAHGKQEDIPLKFRLKLHHGLKEVKKATKKVKTFETQKVVKKLKDARKGGDESNIKSFESQLECLKNCEYEDIAVKSLRTKINKDAFLSKNADCQAAVSSELTHARSNPSEASPVQTLVESRLLSSKVLSVEVANVVQSLKLLLGGGKQEVQEIDQNDGDENDEVTAAEEANVNAPPSKGKVREVESVVDSEEEEEKDEHGDEGNDGEVWTGLNDGSEGNDDADDGESGTGTVSSQGQGSHSDVSDESQSDSSHELAVKKSRPVALPREKKGKAGESTFLPSLSVGFIDGGSDSDYSDAEADLADAPVKKNRRGQRARKAIWEKKYGRNANHIKKQAETDVSATIQAAYGQRVGRGGRGVVRDAAVRGRGRPISEEAPSSYAGPPLGSRGRGRGDTHQSFGDRSKPKQRDNGHGDDSKPLHPSWEAKRKLKEKQSPAIMPSKGTRMTFT